MTEIVYRSTHPDVLAYRDRHIAAYAVWKDRVHATLTELGFEPDRDIWMRDTCVVGVVEIDGEPIPEGWRRDRKDPGAIVPARTTKLGKAYGKKLDELTQPDPRKGLPGGMPGRAFAATGMAFMHCGLQEIGGAIYVTWSSELCGNDKDRIDPAIWEQIKLSEYHAAKEAADEQAKAS